MHCPYIKATDVEIDISGSEFRFYCKPYFLRLHFPAPLIENGKEKSSYDIDSGIVTLHLPKETLGLYFPDLDLLTKLLDIKPAQEKKGPMIQMVEEVEGLAVEDVTADEEEVEFDWSHVQTLPTDTITNCTYGFNNQYHGFGTNIHELAKEILDFKDLDSSTLHSRRQDRLLCEELKFDEDYFMYDFVMNEDIPRILEFTPQSWNALGRIQTAKMELKISNGDGLPEDPFLQFTEEEQTRLLQLTNKRYLIDTDMKPKIYLGIVDILCAYCYNHRTTEGDNTVESAWTICKLSGTLSAFDFFSSLQEVITCFLRRSLSFPLYRSFSLSFKVIQDVVVLLKLGKRAILKAFLEIKGLLEVNDSMYLMDRIFITDYCVWIQKASDKQIKSLASELHHFKVTKDLVDWQLEELEQAALQRKHQEASIE